MFGGGAGGGAARLCLCGKGSGVPPSLPNNTERGSDEAANFSHKQVAAGCPGSDDQNSPHSAMWHRRRLIFCSATRENLSYPFMLPCKFRAQWTPRFHEKLPPPPP